jgi:hypothetical protein
METNKLTIEDLFSDSGPVDESAIVAALMPFLVIQKPGYAIFFKDVKLSAERRILAYALAKGLLKRKGLLAEGTVTALEIAEKTGLKKGTVDPNFKLLKEKGLLAGKGDYEIPGYKIKDAVDLINKEAVA